MAWRVTFPGTREEPEERESTAPAECAGCGYTVDLDEDDYETGQDEDGNEVIYCLDPCTAPEEEEPIAGEETDWREFEIGPKRGELAL